MRVVFMGTPELAATVLQKVHESGYEIVCCVTQPDKPVGRKMILTAPPAKEKALELGIPVWQPQSLRTDEALETLRSYAPDLVITAAYGKILPQTMLDLPKYGAINVHGSLLPKYRGAAPVQWSILNLDEKTGVTIMKMDAGMDTGDILTQAEIKIEDTDHTTTLMQKLADLGAELLVSTLPDYLEGKIKPIPQDPELATVAPPISKEQGNIDWNRTAAQICAQIRALSQWPGASTVWKDGRMKIYDAVVDEKSESLLEQYIANCGQPVSGTVIFAKKGVLAVMCQDKPLNLLEVQPSSGKRMKVIDCAHNFEVGKVMGEEA